MKIYQYFLWVLILLNIYSYQLIYGKDHERMVFRNKIDWQFDG